MKVHLSLVFLSGYIIKIEIDVPRENFSTDFIAIRLKVVPRMFEKSVWKYGENKQTDLLVAKSGGFHREETERPKHEQNATHLDARTADETIKASLVFFIVGMLLV